jgi:benzoyl-CoA reductase/2-hydroxyglutaryl-CoA dehydratase subunit BcrC/BadD/HgdB
MPKEEFNRELEALLLYLEKRKAPLKWMHPRLLMSGEYLDDPGYVELVEGSGAAVVMDDFDTGSKYFWKRVNGSSDPWESLADRYMTKPGTARMANWNEQADQMVQWMKEFDTKGVVELRQLYSLPLDYRFFVIKKRFEKANIPYISLSREYHLANVGMLRTRVEAFIEMIQAKG